MIADLFAAADQSLFKHMLNNEQHAARENQRQLQSTSSSSQ